MATVYEMEQMEKEEMEVGLFSFFKYDGLKFSKESNWPEDWLLYVARTLHHKTNCTYTRHMPTWHFLAMSWIL